MITVLVVSGIAIVFLLGANYFLNTPDKTVRPFSHKNGVLLTAQILQIAKREIKIRGGEMTAEFCSHPLIMNALKKAISERVKIRILLGPKLDVDNTKFLSLVTANKDRIEVRWHPKRQMPHFIIVDDEFLSLEDDHERLEKRNGIVGRTLLCSVFEEYFDDLWEKADARFDLEQRIKEATPIVKGDVDDDQFGFIKRGEGKILFADQESIEKLQRSIPSHF